MSSCLIVDDHPAICFAIKTIINSLGYTATTANNGITAIAKVKEQTPDLVILDIMLNKMDGLQILKHIRCLDDHVKVIIYTSLPIDIYAERSLRAGACGFFSKDNDISQLGHMCALVMNGYLCFPQKAILLATQPNDTNAKSSIFDRLSDREITVLRYLSSGLKNKEIAEKLLLSNKTIGTYKSRIMEKLQVRTTDQLLSIINNQDSQHDR